MAATRSGRRRWTWLALLALTAACGGADDGGSGISSASGAPAGTSADVAMNTTPATGESSMWGDLVWTSTEVPSIATDSAAGNVIPVSVEWTDLFGGIYRFEVALEVAHREWVHSTFWSPDGERWALASSWDGTLVQDPSSGQWLLYTDYSVQWVTDEEWTDEAGVQGAGTFDQTRCTGRGPDHQRSHVVEGETLYFVGLSMPTGVSSPWSDAPQLCGLQVVDGAPKVIDLVTLDPGPVGLVGDSGDSLVFADQVLMVASGDRFETLNVPDPYDFDEPLDGEAAVGGGWLASGIDGFGGRHLFFGAPVRWQPIGDGPIAQAGDGFEVYSFEDGSAFICAGPSPHGELTKYVPSGRRLEAGTLVPTGIEADWLTGPDGPCSSSNDYERGVLAPGLYWMAGSEFVIFDDNGVVARFAGSQFDTYRAAANGNEIVVVQTQYGTDEQGNLRIESATVHTATLNT